MVCSISLIWNKNKYQKIFSYKIRFISFETIKNIIFKTLYQIIRVVSIFSKLHFRGIATNRVTFNGSILSCWKKSVYQNAVVKSDETSTYQELNISENAYQNTTIRWLFSSIQHKTCIGITTAILFKIQ